MSAGGRIHGSCGAKQSTQRKKGCPPSSLRSVSAARAKRRLVGELPLHAATFVRYCRSNSGQREGREVEASALVSTGRKGAEPVPWMTWAFSKDGERAGP